MVRMRTLTAGGLFAVILVIAGIYGADRWHRRSGGVPQPNDKLLVVSCGDSVASGEGCPDTPATSDAGLKWADATRHFSKRCATALVASAIGADFVSNAASGAKITEVESQLGAVAAELKGRKIDALIMSVGANDIEFPMLCRRLVHHGNPLSQLTCDTIEREFLYGAPGYKPVPLTQFDNEFRNLHDFINELRKRPENPLNVEDSHIFFMAFPDATSDDSLDASRVDILDDYHDSERESVNGSINHDDLRWARYRIVRPLNDKIRHCAQREGWNFIPGTERAFLKHGYGASEPNRWICTAADSRRIQQDQNGTLHPNYVGQQAIAWHLAQAALPVLAPQDLVGTSHSTGQYAFEGIHSGGKLIKPEYVQRWIPQLGYPPESIYREYTEEFGTANGKGQFLEAILKPGQRIGRIEISHNNDFPGSVCRTIEVFAADGTPLIQAGRRRNGQLWRDNVTSTFELRDGEFVQDLNLKGGKFIDSIAIVTNQRTGKPFGTTRGITNWSGKVPIGSPVVGFAVGEGYDELNAFRLIYETP